MVETCLAHVLQLGSHFEQLSLDAEYVRPVVQLCAVLRNEFLESFKTKTEKDILALHAKMVWAQSSRTFGTKRVKEYRILQSAFKS